MACTCDYSYICAECQDRIDRELADEARAKVTEWLIAAVKALAEKADVELPPLP